MQLRLITQASNIRVTAARAAGCYENLGYSNCSAASLTLKWDAPPYGTHFKWGAPPYGTHFKV
ncbi:hypothetical protein T484DRAFT_1827766 [Baffinella frigidus]|nr:hypothetical protein T484DRAFT_1827766 [Cryptophyta sp. CCMP2293]